MADQIITIGSAPIAVRVSAAQGPSGPAAMVMQTPVASFSALPASGNSTNDGRVTNDTGNAYRWTGSAWALVGPFRGVQGEVGPEGPAGTGDPDIPATPLPPENPRDGQPWRESGTQILSYWDASETAWIVPTTNSIPAGALTFGGDILTFGGEILTFAAA